MCALTVGNLAEGKMLEIYFPGQKDILRGNSYFQMGDGLERVTAPIRNLWGS